MSIANPLPYFALMGWFIGVAYFLAPAHQRHSPKLHIPLESLRGLLATSVIFYHAIITHLYFTTGKWERLPVGFYSFMGSGPVTLFFFLSGYLFWSKCITDGGISHITGFYASRIRRLVPAYHASLVLVLFIVFFKTRFTFQVGAVEFIKELVRWLLFGIPGIAPPLNGLAEAPLINASVLWTLQLEVVFYLLLPLIYRVFKNRGVFLFVGGLALTYARLSQYPVNENSSSGSTIVLFLIRFFAFGFGLGMVAAFLKSKTSPQVRSVLSQRRWSFVPIVFLALPILTGATDFSVLEFALLFVVFLFVAAGNDLYGLLSTKPVLFLGTISYSFYITHGIVLYSLSHLINSRIPFQALSFWPFWLFIGVCGTMAVCLATFFYWKFESPFLQRGSALAVPPSPAQNP